MTADKMPTDRPVRVCHMIGSLQVGGAERQFVNLLNHLPHCRRYALFVLHESDDGLYRLLDSDIEKKWLGLRLRWAPIHIWRMARQLRRWKIDVLHTHMFWPNLYGAFAARLAGVPVFVTSEHGKEPGKLRWRHWCERHVITPQARMRICVSKDILEDRSKRDRVPLEKLLVIPNGIELPIVSKHDDEYEHRIVIGTLGRFVPVKDYLTLIRAAAYLRKDADDFCLYILGDGPERAVMEEEVERLDLGMHVVLPGIQNDVAGWLSRFDIFVMSSISEGQPMALLEAMSHGLPVVATAVGGIPETVQSGREGVLVPPRDPRALAGALLMLMRNRALRDKLGAAGRLHCERNYSVSHTAEAHYELYQQLLMIKHNVSK